MLLRTIKKQTTLSNYPLNSQAYEETFSTHALDFRLLHRERAGDDIGNERYGG